MAHNQHPSDGYTLQHLEAVPSVDALDSVCGSLSSGDVSPSADRALANMLLHAACEKQPWTTAFDAKFHKTIQLIESASAPCFSWLPLAKDIVCTLLPSLATETSGQILQTRIDSIHAVIRRLYSTPGVEPEAAENMFGEVNSDAVDEDLLRAVHCMRGAFSGEATGLPLADAATPPLWPLALSASDVRQDKAQDDALCLPAFSASLALGLPLHRLQDGEQAVAARAAAESAAAAAAAAAGRDDETQAQDGTIATNSTAPVPGAPELRLAGRKREREEQPPATANAPAPVQAPTQRDLQQEANSLPAPIQPKVQLVAQSDQSAPLGGAPEPPKGQAAFDNVLRSYPQLSSSTRDALHSFMVQRNIDPSFAPAGLTEEGHFDYLLEEKQERDKKGRLATYRYDMRLFFDGGGVYNKRRSKVKAAAGAQASASATA